MIGAVLVVDDVALVATTEDAVTAGRRYAAAFPRAMRPVGEKAVERLATEPGKPRYPLRWKSERQRRYVMAKLRREDNLPYERTHALAEGWRHEAEADERGGRLEVANDSDVARFVQGDDAQPYHLDTGWEQADDVAAELRDEAFFAAADLWYDVTGAE